AHLIARVDGISEPLAGIVESEFRHVADVYHLAARQIVQHEVRALGATWCRRRACAASGRCASAGRGVGGVGITLHREPPRLVTVEGKATHLVEFFLLAGGEVDERHLVVARRRRRRCTASAATSAATATRAATRLRRIDSESRPPRIRRDHERRTTACARAVGSGWAAATGAARLLADREAHFLGGL